MSPGEIQVKINVARREMEFWQELLTKKSCKDCEHFPHGVCKLAGDILPPPDVVATGCDSWGWDNIPF